MTANFVTTGVVNKVDRHIGVTSNYNQPRTALDCGSPPRARSQDDVSLEFRYPRILLLPECSSFIWFSYALVSFV